MTDKLLIDRELLEQICVELEHDNDRYMLGRELRKALSTPPADSADMGGQAGEEVEVRGLQWLDTGHYRKKPPQFGYNPHDWNPLMTVAQHKRILAASVPAGCKVVPVELLELLHEMVDLHERRGTVLTVQMEELRALLASAEGVRP